MFNPELQAALDEEINKAPQETQDLIRSQEFTDTIALITRVNKLSEEEKKALTLETIMLVLGISDYPTIEAALNEQVLAERKEITQKDVNQITSDLEEYVFKNLFHKQAPTKLVVDGAKEGEGSSKSLRESIITNKEGSLIRPGAFDLTPTETPLITEREPVGDVYREHIDESDKVLRVG